MNKKYLSAIIGLASVASLAIALPASAQSVSPAQPAHPMWQGGGTRGAMKPGVFGTVASINGNILTVTGRNSFGGPRPMTTGGTTSVAPVAPTPVTYTVDATNATVMKNNATSSLSAIVVGDTVMAQGTLTGTNLVATKIRDGVVSTTRTGGAPGTMHPGMASTTPAFSGNGEPITAGAVTAISGSSITITNKSNVTYTVDATNAKIVTGNTTGTISNVAVGDSIVVQGTVNGTSVTATTIIDQAKPANASATAGKPAPKGFFGSIGSFFSHLFGF